ncbi:hypothetical protein BHE74_00053050 [Ensete ventricosum]|nr:hypothetical protein BHE74_00053050 [Ensete ventricosum]
MADCSQASCRSGRMQHRVPAGVATYGQAPYNGGRLRRPRAPSEAVLAGTAPAMGLRSRWSHEAMPLARRGGRSL